MNDTATSAGPSTKREDAPSPIESDSEKTTKEPPKKKQKRTKKSPPDYAAMARDFPQRIVAASSKAIGYHASASGGAETAPFNALKTGSTAFALFLKNQRQWASKPFNEETLRLFPLHCGGKTSLTVDDQLEELGDGKGFDLKRHVIPHGSYLVNLGNPTPDKWDKAFEGFLDEAKRAEQLGIAYLNIHPGSSTGVVSREEAIQSIARGINRVHELTNQISILLENMAGKGNVIGGQFEDLREIIALVEDKTRVGVTFDTCHAFAAGYDLRTPEDVSQTLSRFDEIVGLSSLKAFHFNDSKGEFQSHRDLHENIGCGHIGLVGFACLMADSRLDGLPCILETPELAPDEKNYKQEILLLHKLEVIAKASSPSNLASNIHADDGIQGIFKQLKADVDRKLAETNAKKQAAKSKKSKKNEKEDSE